MILVMKTLWSLSKSLITIFFFTIKFGFPNILILSLVIIFFIPILFKSFDPHFNLGLSFWFNSDKFLNVDIPFALAAIKKIKRNSSIAAVLKLVGQFIGLNDWLEKIWRSPIFSPFSTLVFLIIKLTFIFFKIFKIPILVGFIFTDLITKLDLFDKTVSTIKKALELMSEGIL